jgi:hypothetical protein
VAAAAVRDAAVSFRGEEVHLVFPVVAVQGPTVGECYHGPVGFHWFGSLKWGLK